MTGSTSPLPFHSSSPLPCQESSRHEVSEELARDVQSARVLSSPSTSPLAHPNGSFFASSSPPPRVDSDETEAIEETRSGGGNPSRCRTHEEETKKENHSPFLPHLQETCFSTPKKNKKKRGNSEQEVPPPPPPSSPSAVLSSSLSHPPVMDVSPVADEKIPRGRHLSVSSFLSSSTQDTPLAPWRTSVLAVVNPLSGERGAVKHLLRELYAVLGKERVHVLNAETFAHPETLGQHILDTALSPRYPPSSSSSSGAPEGKAEWTTRVEGEEKEKKKPKNMCATPPILHHTTTTPATSSASSKKIKKNDENAFPTAVRGGGRSDARGTVVVAGGDGTISFVYAVLSQLMAAALPYLHIPSSSSSSSRTVEAVEHTTEGGVERRGSVTTASGYTVPPPPPGAVGWYLPALSPIPLGTGNDYANCMGFGAHYSGGKIWDHHSRPPPPPSSPKDKSSLSSSVLSYCGKEDHTVVRKEVREDEVVEVSEKRRGGRGGGLLTAPCYPFDVWTVSFFSLSVVQTVANAASNRTRFSSSSSSGGVLDEEKKKEEEDLPTGAAAPSSHDAVNASPSDSFSTLSDVFHAMDWTEVERLQKMEVDARKAQDQQWKEKQSIIIPLSTTREEEDGEAKAQEDHHSPQENEFDANPFYRRRTKNENEEEGAAAVAPISSASSSPPPLLPPSRMSFINYVGIGFDAYVTAKFDKIRRAHPKFCSTRMANKLTYGVESIAAAVRCSTLRALIPMVCVMPPSSSSSPIDPATTSEEVEEDVGEAVTRTRGRKNEKTAGENGRWRQPPLLTAVGLPGSSKALVITNVDSYAAGCKPWGSSHSYSPPHDGTIPTTTTTHPSPKTKKTVEWKKCRPYAMVHMKKKKKENENALQEVLVREKQMYRYTFSDSPHPSSSSPKISFPLSAGLPAFQKAAIDDGLLEVQCMDGIVHYANLQLRLTTADRLAQASEIIIFVLCTPMDVLLPTVGAQSPYSKKAFRKVREMLQKTTKKKKHVTIPSLHVQVDGEAVTPIQEAMILRVTRASDVVWGRCTRKSVVSRE